MIEYSKRANSKSRIIRADSPFQDSYKNFSSFWNHEKVKLFEIQKTKRFHLDKSVILAQF